MSKQTETSDGVVNSTAALHIPRREAEQAFLVPSVHHERDVAQPSTLNLYTPGWAQFSVNFLSFTISDLIPLYNFGERVTFFTDFLVRFSLPPSFCHEGDDHDTVDDTHGDGFLM